VKLYSFREKNSDMKIYEKLKELTVNIEDVKLERNEKQVTEDFNRVTTTVKLKGPEKTGYGEDVIWEAEEHDKLQENIEELELKQGHTLEDFSERLSLQDLFFGEDPPRQDYRNYRTWAFESAALDLALKQKGISLAEALGEQYAPLNFVASPSLGDPPSMELVQKVWDQADVGLKLDATDKWSDELIQKLSESGKVKIVDLKGHYEDEDVRQGADPELYKKIVEKGPQALIEDPVLNDETRPIFEGEEARVTWDEPITSVGSIKSLPFQPEVINIKPSRFGSIRKLLDAIEYCRNNNITMYGGGQFELGKGRQHIQAFASIFYPESVNDIAPKNYNDREPENLTEPPLMPEKGFEGLEWKFRK
jgi:L-alanine-DL-glutamate epimerase-like enolase superfamily enzyme